MAIRTPDGWEITEAGKERLRELHVTNVSPAAGQIAADLRSEITKIVNPETRSFVEEAISCYEAQLYRSAIVMSWLAAMSVLHDHVHRTRLAAFNAEVRRVDSRWRDARTTDDFGRMSEGDFLERAAAISMVGKNVKAELRDCLNRRNACGHPNSLKIGANTVAHHIEVLILNVFKAF